MKARVMGGAYRDRVGELIEGVYVVAVDQPRAGTGRVSEEISDGAGVAWKRPPGALVVGRSLHRASLGVRVSLGSAVVNVPVALHAEPAKVGGRVVSALGAKRGVVNLRSGTGFAYLTGFTYSLEPKPA